MNRLEERLKILTQPKLLIIDEIGYIPIDRQGANLFVQRVSRRYERGAILLTSNQSLGAWGEVFGDAVPCVLRAPETTAVRNVAFFHGRSMVAGLPVCAPSPDGERVDSGGAMDA